ncbi:MAG TPA: serine/threonine-protein kinase [Kiritimatiellia bacterium]|nr:serine/threonine-protein kinase [Kiritimatiellia bacterium]
MIGMGQEFAGYAITRRLASGGMTYLYVGVDNQQNRVVIRRLKAEYLRDRRVRANFLNGAQFLGNLHHPNVVRLIKAGLYQDEPFTVVEFVEARNLRELILRKDPLLYQNTLTIMRQMAAAMSYVHLSGFLHLDIKPENFIVRNDGLLILIDFDLAIERKPKPVKLSPLPGTFAYLPPETLLRNLVDEQTDIYAFGVTCYEMLTGHKPFEGVTLEDARKAQVDPNGRPTRFRFHNVNIPPSMENLILKCLAYRQIDRYPSMSLVMRDLETMV